MRKIYASIVILVYALGLSQAACARERSVELGGISWLQISGKHFLVLYADSSDERLAKRTLKTAEKYYYRLTDDLGFRRRSDFWTWENRARIVIFQSQEEFVQRTGAPVWALGYADRDHYLTQSRLIVTYRQESDFFDGLLPHEIGHLVVQDFVPQDHMPIWFEEGIAQMGEANKADIAQRYMRNLIQQGQYIPLDVLSRWDIRNEKDAKKVEVFYAESISVIKFLRSHYGASGFKRLCRNIRDGHGMEDAIRLAYPGRLDSLKALEKAWVSFLSAHP